MSAGEERSSGAEERSAPESASGEQSAAERSSSERSSAELSSAELSSALWRWRGAEFLLVFAGGAVGTLARELLEHAHPARAGAWPMTTFAINLVAALLLGLVTGSLSGVVSRRALLLTALTGAGLISGFSTFSTMVVEAVQQSREGFILLAVAYPVVSMLLGILCAGLGLWGGGRLAAARARRRGARA